MEYALQEEKKDQEWSGGSAVNIFILSPNNDDGTIDQVVESIMGNTNVSVHVQRSKRREIRSPFVLKRADSFNWDLLSDRELAVFHLMLEGDENKDIAQKLGISDKTVKNHVSSILLKMKVKNRTQAVIFAFQTSYAKIV
ncbi:response regulator transcription factor [Brevibacillus centrosporus]|uniref:response regulator transcription factor n=1 Tax=Brevibacillus centrosporus TaxID=54910 RepID=UPI00117011FC|nr:response regulator transcription factor [Brevibacillus centrosporus]MEC2133278.1 response regulator transcription factor [Brevibacillus centrosporus]GED34480.1 hypothetical protein BCE02nite_56210 [Brevibacillus centrosporus]